MSQCKHAILIGSSEFPKSGGRLPSLGCAATDVQELQTVLSDPQLSTFDHVQVALDLPHWEVLLRVNKVIRKASREDQILLYYSGHGLLDNNAKLHLATVNTEPELLQATTIPADNLRSLFRETQCRRIIIILDCCFAGAVGEQLQLDRFLKDSFQDSGDAISRGYAVCAIAATAANQAAYAPGTGETSYMTGIMVDAIRSGKADRNRDGIITIEEIYDYTRREMLARKHSAPVIFHRGVVSSLTIASSPMPMVWDEIVERILRRIDEVRPSQEGEGGNPANLNILDRAREILALPEETVLQTYEALLSLLKDWSVGRLGFDELMNQWYQFDRTDLVATDVCTDTCGLAEHWNIIRQSRAAVLDLITPSYILDRNYHFLDWNSAFDELVAKQMGLIRFRHVEDFILRLDNHREVIERGQRTFSEDSYPLVDIEDLEYTSPRHGRIVFKKIASQIPDQEGEILAWSVNLNIASAEKADTLWQDLQERLNEEVNWSIYAKLYDRMLNKFDAYGELVGQMVDLLGDAEYVVDLGAGTGNVLAEMLRRKPDRTVLAVEGNEEMLDQLRAKFRNGLGKQAKRVRIFKGDIIESLREVDENTFDGVIMVNVLYALHNRPRCLREIYRVLKPGGVVVYSTSTDMTDVDALFASIREDMRRKGILRDMTPVIDLAYERHQAMDEQIHKDSESAVVDYARHAGFDVDAGRVLHRQYAGAVTIVKAVKPTFMPHEHEEEEQAETTPPVVQVQPTADGVVEAPRLFISYAHEDTDYCERILKYLKPAVDANHIDIWVDSHIDLGQEWGPEIEDNINRSSMALLLVTPDFLNSEYIKRKELPWLITRRAHGKMEIIPVLLKRAMTDAYAYPYQAPDGTRRRLRLGELQFMQAGDKSMLELDTAQQNVFIDGLAQRILEQASRVVEALQPQTEPAQHPPISPGP